MSESTCPDLQQLESMTSAVRAHVLQCRSCDVVAELLAERKRGEVARDKRAECRRFEVLLAARDEGALGANAIELLDAHLRECAACSVVAQTRPPQSARGATATLPQVDIGSYALGREVARGGMGRIIAATDLRIGREVAVKELVGRDAGLAARFEREARVTARLQHPSIVPIYEIGRWPDGTPFYSMRMVAGRTLRTAIRTKRDLDQRLALLPSVIAAADAVAFAHARGVIHRDLTPNNILVGDFGDTVVIDWGLAKDLNNADDVSLPVNPYRDKGAGLTMTGTVVGTAAYMPPEQARGESVDRRADVYGLGAILYDLLSGRAPYEGESSDEVLAQLQAAPPPSVATIAPGAPRDLVSLVDKAMARDPSDRYSDARELADELRRFQAGRIVEAHVYTPRERVKRWVRSHRPAVFAILAATLAIVVAGSIGAVGVVRERDRAQREALTANMQSERAARASDQARRDNAALMTEQGRQELLAGNTNRALAWLREAYRAGDTSPELRFLLGTAMQTVDAIAHHVKCGAPITSVEFSRDSSKLLVSCGYSLLVVDAATGALHMRTSVHLNHAVFSPDARFVVARRYDTVTVLDVSTGATLYEKAAHQGFIRATHVTPDGKTLVTAGDDGKLRIWELATGALRHTIDAQSGSMNVIRASLFHDGTSVVTGTGDGRVNVWDVATGARRNTFEMGIQPLLGDDGFVSPDDTRIVACAADGSVRVHDLATGKLVINLTAHTAPALSCNFDHTGTRVVSAGGRDGTVKVWDVASTRLVATIEHGSLLAWAQLTGDGRRVLTLSRDGIMKMWHVETGSLLASLDDPTLRSELLATSASSRYAAVVLRPNVVSVLDLSRAGPQPLVVPSGFRVGDVSPDGRQVTIHDSSGLLTLVSTATGERLAHEPVVGPVRWSRDSTRFAAMTPAGNAVVLDAKTGRTLRTVQPAARPIWLELDLEGKRLLLAGRQGRAVDVDSGDVLLEGGPLHLEGLSRTGRFVAAWSDARKIEVHDLGQRRVVTTIPLPTAILHPLDFDDTETRLLLTHASDAPNTNNTPFFERVMLVEVASGRPLFTANGRAFTNADVACRHFASAGLNSKLEIRRMSDGALVSTLLSEGSFLMSGTMDPDRQFVMVNDWMTVSIRSAADGRVLGQMQATVHGLAISQDSLNFGGDPGWYAWESRQVVTTGPAPLAWKLPREERSADEIDRILAPILGWKVERGHLVPVEASLHGRVLRDGKPVAGATVGLATGQWLTVTTGADGRFAIPELSPGEYFIIAIDRDKTAKGVYPVVVSATEVVRDFVLDEVATISGTVVDEDGKPVAGVTLRAGRQEGAMRAVSNERGEFTIRALGAETFDVHVLRVIDGQPTGFESEGQRVTVPAKDAAVTGLRFVVRRTR